MWISWRTPSYFGRTFKDNPAISFPVKVAHTPRSNNAIRLPPTCNLGELLLLEHRSKISETALQDRHSSHYSLCRFRDGLRVFSRSHHLVLTHVRRKILNHDRYDRLQH